MPPAKPFDGYVVNSLYDNNFFTDDLPHLLNEAGSAQEGTKSFRIVNASLPINFRIRQTKARSNQSSSRPCWSCLVDLRPRKAPSRLCDE